MLSRWWHYVLAIFLGMLVVAVAVAGLASALIYPSLPSLDVLTDYKPKMPLRIYTSDGVLISEFGEERRAVVRIHDAPTQLKQAILAAEDDRFYEHGGVDTMGIARAAVANILSGSAKEGASTITMQVARNFFLTSEKTVRRKLNEALLALKIEHSLSKNQILELYINQIYLGQRAYGFAAASQIYFGKPLAKIDLAEAAMLAGLPKAPSAYNPVVNPTRAKTRQLYVLRRMRELGQITETQFAQAAAKKIQVRYSSASADLNADHIAEMARQYVVQRYGEQVYVSGMKVYTTLVAAEQKAAVEGVRLGVVNYNRRHGYIGPEASIQLPNSPEEAAKAIDSALMDRPEVNGMLPAVVLAVGKDRLRARLRSGDGIELGASELKFAARFLDSKLPAQQRLRPGSIVRVYRLAASQPWQLTYLPQVEAGLIGLSPKDGAISAMVGGFSFSRNQFNHITQAWRQPGSSFKPFIYSAALETGITPGTVFDDAPISLSAEEAGGEAWEPKNYDGTVDGPTTVRNALTHSKNLVSIRLLQATGLGQARQHSLIFGFTPERIQPYLTLALGVGEVTPLQLATGYAVFANHGMRIKSHYLVKVTDKDGKVLETFQPQAPEPVLDSRNAFIMTTMMQDVVRRGTAAAASRLGRGDIAGKTGTTNDHRDAWFAGYSPNRVAVAWMGYDQPKPLGPGETGGTTALPIWMHYMATALRAFPDQGFAMPGGISVLNVDPATGARVTEGGRAEYYYDEFAPGSSNVENKELVWGAVMDSSPHHQDTTKARIAQLAAQLMAEHGIRDHALAKRKALRQLGLTGNQALPGNEEVDAALREYRALYEPDEQQAELSALRHQALEAMHDLEPFPLLLVGGVANGAVARHSDIEFDLYLDATKSFEQFLLKEGIAYESSDRGGQARFLLYAEPANVQVRILPENAQHQVRRVRQDGPSRLTRTQLEKLLRDADALAAKDKND